MSEPRQVRDPIFGFVPLRGREARVVNTPIFQRLRGIRQLAFASLVYPGALHTRFEHSLGVCHIAGLLAKSLKCTDEDEGLVRLAALLHDVGHGPFSHVSENALELYADRTKLGDKIREKERIHEAITADIVRNHADLTKLIGEPDCHNIATLLEQGYGEPFLRAIVSGPLDADKQDYLLRDSYFCGVKYGVFDIQQLHRELTVWEDPADGSKQLMISRDGIHAIEQFVLAKYYLTTQVYRHRVRLITDQMLSRAITLGVEDDGIEELKKPYSYDGTCGFAERYVQWDDARFLFTFTDDRFKNTACHELLTRLQRRRLLKRVYEKRLSRLPEACWDPVTRISDPDSRELRRQVEERLHEMIREALGRRGPTGISYGEGDSRFVIVHAYTVKSVREQSRDDEGPILVDNRPTPTTFEEESSLFRSIDESLNEAYVEVYVPVTYDDPTQRRELINVLDGPITETITSLFGKGADNAHA